ncbi:hypothetical protein ACLOJK_026928 [Asimina triloba]
MAEEQQHDVDAPKLNDQVIPNAQDFRLSFARPTINDGAAEQVNFVNNTFNQRPVDNPYSNTYNPG